MVDISLFALVRRRFPILRIVAAGLLLNCCACRPAKPAAPPGAEPAARPAKPAPPAASQAADYPRKKCEVRKLDPKGGTERHVLEGVVLTARTTQRLDMMYSSVVGYSFVPESTAQALGAETVGEIDLAPPAPPPLTLIGISASQPALPPPPNDPAASTVTIDVPAHLRVIYGMNRTGQTKFRVVRIERVDLGVGPPLGPVTALVLDDANSAFGVIGGEWLRQPQGPAGFVHAAVGEGCPNGALYYGVFTPPAKP